MRKSSSIGSIRGEWNACETVNARVRTPRSSHTPATARTASTSPEMTVASGPLTAAIATRPSNPDSVAATSSAPACTDTIAPPAGNACINRPRAATSAHASSNDNTPATCAAVISPIECPSR